jgi:hypothetical protein
VPECVVLPPQQSQGVRVAGDRVVRSIVDRGVHTVVASIPVLLRSGDRGLTGCAGAPSRRPGQSAPGDGNNRIPHWQCYGFWFDGYTCAGRYTMRRPCASNYTILWHYISTFEPQFNKINGLRWVFGKNQGSSVKDGLSVTGKIGAYVLIGDKQVFAGLLQRFSEMPLPLSDSQSGLNCCANFLMILSRNCKFKHQGAI